MKYRRVNLSDRHLLKAYLDMGIQQNAIAAKLGVSASTVSREISRNIGLRGYRVNQAQRKSEERQLYRSRPRKLFPKLVKQIEDKLELKWSPEQISCRMKKEGKATVCSETIYRHVYKDSKEGGDLWQNLRRSNRRRKPRFPRKNEVRGTIRDAQSIGDRPLQAEKREKTGHWERDCMLGKDRKTGVLVITDRKSRYNLLSKLNRRSAVIVTRKTINALKGLPIYSITNDRGQEFSDHKKLMKKLGVGVYFCDPYSSYQRGSNENRIGILRQYFPKGADLAAVAGRDLKLIQFQMNNRPMKILDWKTPYEVMMKKNCTAFV